MRRREFITLVGGAATWPFAARGEQSERVQRIGVLMAFEERDPESERRITALRRGLQELGWREVLNVGVDFRWGAGDQDLAQAAAQELVGLQPDVIVAHASLSVMALRRETSTLPIVFSAVNEPVTQGFVTSLAHPGGNITGFTNLEPTVGAKWLEVLKEIAPRIRRVAVMFNPDATPIAIPFSRSIQEAAEKFEVEVVLAPVYAPADIEKLITMWGQAPAGGLIFPPDTFLTVHRKQIVDLAARHQIPAISANRSFAADGCLLSYSINAVDQFRQVAGYVDRILRGAKPGDLPVQQPTKFDLVINLSTAKALGLEVPATLLALADEVIE
jgi:putative ABC transport system substrate-binding protein